MEDDRGRVTNITAIEVANVFDANAWFWVHNQLSLCRRVTSVKGVLDRGSVKWASPVLRKSVREVGPKSVLEGKKSQGLLNLWKVKKERIPGKSERSPKV